MVSFNAFPRMWATVRCGIEIKVFRCASRGTHHVLYDRSGERCGTVDGELDVKSEVEALREAVDGCNKLLHELRGRYASTSNDLLEFRRLLIEAEKSEPRQREALIAG